MTDWQPLAPACTKCEAVTGKTTCFPAPCVFYHERNTPGTQSHNIATLDRIRRGSLDPVYASGIAARSDETPQEVRPEGQEPDPKGDAQ